MEEREKKLLAAYAVLSAKSRGRIFPEKKDETRTEFQRDRDRIIHSKAFRRLSGKTQVFIATYGDHFRDRLSHTLEAAQMARGLARNLRLNEDLAEAIALAHDLGHTPFGHSGEETLNEIMKKHGGRFEHNEQSRRVVEQLEKQFPNFDGLNLTYEVREGLAKHQTRYDQASKRIFGKTLEAQVADVADEIAYHNHDLDDGLRSGLFTLKDLQQLALWKESLDAAEKKYPDSAVLRSRVISHLISLMLEDVLRQTAKNLRTRRIRTLEDVLAQRKNLVSFSRGFKKKVNQLREFLWKHMYQSSKVLKHSRRGRRIIEKLFRRFYKNPQLMPRRFYGKIEQTGCNPVCSGAGCEAAEHIKYLVAKAATVKDYIAGCTDLYASELLED